MQEHILIIGSGAREHAIAEAFARSPQKPELYCFGSARNPGIGELCTAYATGSVTDVPAISAFAARHPLTLAIIGPEAPLAAGAADALWSAGIPVVGPRQSLARIESSKGFTRDLLAKHNIPGNPFFQRFTSLEGVDEVLARFPGRHVIKDDGLAGGKGVKVCGDHLLTLEDSLTFLRELHAAGHPFVIEEKLEGEEFSLLSFSDGITLRHMPAVQDHKRAYEGDRGPNTGGMGSYSAADHSLPFLRPSDITAAHSINERVIAALGTDCGAPYQGILYGGFMATADGVRLIEYNARFGDPECLNLLTLLQTDFVAICRAIANQTLAQLPITFEHQASVCKYVVPEGYPDKPLSGDEVALPKPTVPDATLYLGSVDLRDGKLVGAGSRTLAAVAIADDLITAERNCEAIVSQVPGRFFHRTDIGTEAAINRRIAHMQSLRPQRRLRVGVLGSTRGTALQGILDELATLPIDLRIVISDRATAPILTRATEHGIPALFLSPRELDREAFDAAVTAAFEREQVDLILMIGYMRIVSDSFIAHWRNRMLNVHPSLLPAFGGMMNRNVHEAVLAAGVAETGCTIHHVTEEVDAGPIILQLRCPVLPDDTVDTLKDRVQALEQRAFVQVLKEWSAS